MNFENSNTVRCGGKLLGSEAHFEETQDQLSPRHFENTGSNLFFYVESSYLVNIKPNHSRICWYKKIYSPKYFSPTNVSVSEGGVFPSFPRQRSLNQLFTGVGNRQILSDLIEIYNIPCADVNTSMYQKLLNFVNDYPKKQCAAITGCLPVYWSAIISAEAFVSELWISCNLY